MNPLKHLLLAFFLALPAAVCAAPPFSGTIFIDPDIITGSDPTAFTGLTDAGQAVRNMYDRRVPGFVNINAYLFIATYKDGLQIEFQVNPEFGSVAAARQQAEFYAPVIGRLPTSLRADVQTSWIHMGDEAFGGGNNNLLIHTGSIAQGYINDGILEETFVHEASHTSLDASHANAPGWLAAQQSDPEFISTYARDNPTREDVAESFLPYLAVRYRPDRISAGLENTIRGAIPARIAYFDSLPLNMYPLTDPLFSINAGLNDAWVSADAPLQGLFLTVFEDLGVVFMSWFTFDSVIPAGGSSATFGAKDQRWVTGAGVYSGNIVTINVENTSGGIFNGAIPLASQQSNYGTVTVTFISCSEAILTYNFPGQGLSGQMILNRVLPDNVALCEMLAGP